MIYNCPADGTPILINDYRCECYRAVLIVARSLRVLGNRNDGSHLKDWDKERITMNLPDTRSVHALRTSPGIPSGPVAL